MVLDNARIHHAKLVQSFLVENNNRLQLEFLPPYSPDLNIIEGLWKWLKSNVINNVFFSNVSKIRVAVRGFIDSINQATDVTIKKLCLRM